jgi:MFS family permease
MAVAATLLGDSLMYVVLPVIWRDLGLELWMVGVLLSANRFVRLVTNPLAGRVVERVGLRVPFLLAALTGAATTASYGVLSGFLALLLARTCWGLCWSFLRLGGMLVALRSSDQGGTRGRSLGFYASVVSVGTMLGALIGGALVDRMGFESTMLLFAGITVGITMLVLREPLDGTPMPGDGSSAGPAAGPAHRLRRAILYGTAFMFSAAGGNLLVATLGLWIVELHGVRVELPGVVVGAATVTGVLISLRFAIAIVWTPFAGHLSDRLGRWPFLGIGGVLLAASLFGVAQPGPIGWTASAAVLAFLAGSAVRISLDASVGDLAPPELRPRVMSVYATWGDFGAACGPFFSYLLIGWIGIAGVFRGAAVAMAIAGLIALLALRYSSASSQSRMVS